MVRKSSYRLGRRLRASAKARLDYITYLQSGGDPTFGRVPEVAGQLSVSFALGGDLNGFVGAGALIAAAIGLGGALRANIYPPHVITATFGLGGELTGDVRAAIGLAVTFGLGGSITGNIEEVNRQTIGAEMAGGGELAADIDGFTRQELSAAFDGGGEFTGQAAIRRVIGGEFDGGGVLNGNIFPPVVVRANIQGGGVLIADIVIPKRISAAFSGGGAFAADIEEYINGLEISRVLAVGGGGSGGAWGGYGCGGGGGGGVVEYTTPFFLTPNTYPVVVGAGGNASNGGLSSFAGRSANGGGRGGGNHGNASGGGAGGGGRAGTAPGSPAGSGTSGQGFAGGNGSSTIGGAGGGGGGGGAGGAGAAGSGFTPGTGGIGKLSNIDGTSRRYGGGGGGNPNQNVPGGAGGDGGGGRGGNNNGGAGVNGTNGLGGGGGGTGTLTATLGGSGRVVIRYPGAQRATGGVVTTVGGDTVHTFTSSGNFVVAPAAKRLRVNFAGGGTLTCDVSTDVVIDADAQTIINEMSPAPNTGRQITISNFVTELKNSGVWSKLRAMFVFAAHADAPARLNWKNPTALEAVKSGTLTFNVDVGFTAGSNSGIDTGYALTGMANTSIGMTFKFDQAGLPAASIGVGIEHTNTYLRWLLNPGNPSNLQFVCSIMSDSAVFLAAGPGDLSRNFTIDRNGTTVDIYADGASVHSETKAINKGTIPSTKTAFANAVNRTSTVEFSATDRNQQFMIIHDHLTGTEIAALHTACDNYLANL